METFRNRVSGAVRWTVSEQTTDRQYSGIRQNRGQDMNMFHLLSYFWPVVITTGNEGPDLRENRKERARKVNLLETGH